LLEEMRAEGATDYVAHPLLFGDGSAHVATFSTRAPVGFTDAQLAAIAAIIPPLTRVAEIRALRRTAGNLLDVYVGHKAGEHILSGKIRRGHVEEITAAIWLSDMRGFTARAERMAAQDLIDLLNRYFDCQVPAIAEHGGEVLKFMGDGLLAIFPNEAGHDASMVCRQAFDAAREAHTRVLALAPAPGDTEPVSFGVALHLGRLMYGNIGGGTRLDFTCIGPAVNLAARLEKIAARLGRPIVASKEFARQLPDAFLPLGEFPAAGFAAPQPVVAPPLPA
jgi:adenylate cyclase